MAAAGAALEIFGVCMRRLIVPEQPSNLPNVAGHEGLRPWRALPNGSKNGG